MNPSGAFEVELDHRVGGTPEEVFAYFTEPDKYRRWKGAEAELDPRPGGVYRVMMRPGVWVSGEYVAVEPPHRLLLTWGWESDIDLPPGLGEVKPGTSTVEFTFAPDGDGTMIHVRHVGLPSEEARWVHSVGWNTYLPRLGAVTVGEDPGEDPVTRLTEAYLARAAEAHEKDRNGS